MNLHEIRQLLLHAEQHDIDFKRTFPPNYFGERGRQKDQATATLVKDVAAMANALAPGPAYLVYGVSDVHGERHVVPRVAREREDDARLQQLLARYLDPKPEFWYGEFALEGEVVGVFKVERTADAPHVVKADLGGKIHVGQVFMRSGTSTKIAMSLDLKRLAQPAEPYRTRLNSAEVEVLAREMAAAGWRTSWVLLNDIDDKIAVGAQLVYKQGTRRPYEAPGNHDGSNPMRLMKNRIGD